jgi:hypothetical protein
LKRAFENSIIKIIQSFVITLAQAIQTSNRFPNRRMLISKTKISRHIRIITGVMAVELSKWNFHLKLLCI